MKKLKLWQAAILISTLTIGVFMASSRLNIAEAIYPLPNGRPLATDGEHYCCMNSGNDCGAVCCDEIE